MNYCDKCNKIVPDDEVFQFETDGIKIHRYTSYENIGSKDPNVFGCCLAKVTKLCGNIREPNEQEYFIWTMLK